MKKPLLLRATVALLAVVLLAFSSQSVSAQALTISSDADWETFASNVNGGTSYTGQTVKLAADINVSTMVGTSSNKFKGTFDGAGHKITVNLTASEDRCAPFRYVEDATICMLTVTGTVSTGTNKFGAGLIAESTGSVTVKKCRSSVTISGDRSSLDDKDGTHGGFVSLESSGSLTFINCLFDGSISDQSATNCGGFVGWRSSGSLTFTNCLMAGTLNINTTEGNSATFNRNGSSTLDNSYYITSYGAVQGTDAGNMSNETLLSNLGSNWELSDGKIIPLVNTKSLSLATIAGLRQNYIYTGSAIDLAYVVKDYDGNTLANGTHYDAAITKDGSTVSEVKDKGTYTLIITAHDGSGYTGSQSVTFEVADYVEIGDGTSTNKVVPIATYYNYSISEQLYTAEEIGYAGTITSISFHYTGIAAKDLPISVYMANVDNTNLSTGISLAQADQVFDGTLSVPNEDCWVTITLDTPFAYDGQSNLLIGINKGYLSYYDSNTWYYTATESTMARYSQNDNNAYDIASTVPENKTNDRPNIRIGITPITGVLYDRPANLTVSDLTSTGATISWTVPGGTPTGYTYQYKKVSDADWSAETSVTATSVALSGLKPGEAYIFRVKAVYGTDGASGFTSINFTTDCEVISTFPWSEDFDGYQTGNFNNPCWVNEHIDGSETEIFNISTDQKGENSTKKLQLPDMRQNTTTKLVFPSMNLDGNYQFVLDVYRNNNSYTSTYANEGIRVFVSVDGEIEGATEIGFIPREYNVSSSIIPAEAAIGWYTYRLPIPMTGTCHIILRGESQFCTDTYMDNFVVELSKPLNLTVSDVTKNTATISWIGNATSFNVQYKAASAKDWLTTNATASPLTITGLNDDTEYQVRVQAYYGEQDVLSGWTDVINFTTDVIFCTPKDVVVNNILSTTADIAWTGNNEATSYNLRYTTDIAGDFFEDFENGLSYWTVIRNGEGNEKTDWRILDPYAFSTSLPSAHSGNSAVLSRSYSSGKGYNVDNWLISPKVSLGSTMTFWMIGDPDYPEHYEVYVSTTTTDLDAFTKVYESDEAFNDWTLKTVDLSAYAGQKGYVAFRNIDYDADYLFIDDVTITAPPMETVEWTTVNNITNPYSIEGLTPNTLYTVEVQAVYADGESKWSSTNFKTLDLDAAPFNLQATDVTANTVTLDWDGVQDSYNVRYRKNSVVYSTLFNSSEDREEWNYNTSVYGVEDTVNNISGDDNFLLEMGWNSTDEQFIISPKLPAYPSGSILEFYHFYYYDENTFQVGYSTTTNETEAFTWSEPIETVSYNDAYSVKFSEVLPYGVKYIAFKATAEDRDHCIFIDNLKIYKGGVSDDEWNDVNANTNTLALTELAPNTNYEWQVQGIYNGEPTEWSKAATFATDALEIELANDATNNAALIEKYDGEEKDVKLTGRTLYKDGKWNTICLPFDVEIEGSVLEGAVARTLTSASVTDNETSGQTLHLTFSEAVTTLEAGVPYIIKWTEGDNITDPVFPGVTISNTYEGFDNGVAGDYRVRFLGSYNSVSLAAYDKSHLYFGANNKLLWPDQNVTLGACRAYFKIGGNNAVNAKGITGFVIDFGENDEEATGINEAAADSSLFTPHSSLSEWHTVDGIRLNGKPSKKGMYIHNGKKVVVE